MRGFYFKLLLVLLSLACSLLIAEGAARWFLPSATLSVPSPPSEIDPYQPNPYILSLAPFISLHIPGAHYTQVRRSFRVDYQINSRGFRGPELDSGPPHGWKRLIIVGDSVVEGHGVDFELALPSLLDQSLRQFGWEVLNLGVQGASPIYYAANLPRYLSLQPTAVLLVLFENDLYEDRFREGRFLKLPRLDSRGFQSLRLRPPEENWCLPLLVRRALRLPDESPVQEIVANNRSATRSDRERREVAAYRAPLTGGGYLIPSALFEKHWNLSSRYLDEVERTFGQHNVSLIVASLSMSVLEQRGASFVEHAQNLERQAERWSQGKGLPFLSLTESVADFFEQTPALKRLSFQDDPHPNTRVYGVMADLLHPWLMKHLGVEGGNSLGPSDGVN